MFKIILMCLLMAMPAFASMADDLSYQPPPGAVDLQHVAWAAVQNIDKANIGISGWMPTKESMSDLGPYFAGIREAVQGINETLTSTQVEFVASEVVLPASVGNASENVTVLGDSA
ncbi:hypothetical protein M0R72_14995 [Candidatus Pacearchaeota archaeon]|jgi:hypothetical protein|nr:hypothetical protein [Candidatus Pacearchaeota archaeon]